MRQHGYLKGPRRNAFYLQLPHSTSSNSTFTTILVTLRSLFTNRCAEILSAPVATGVVRVGDMAAADIKCFEYPKYADHVL